ncbi:MAG: T9SS type A sorting domain-containing protein [Ignavibacteria bacterium]|nr:T9SS type A sorting domain-containing protein [Ignavibacteria bacterium]
MRKVLLLISISVFFLNSCQPTSAQIQIEPAFPNLSFEQPVDIQYAKDGSNRLFIVSQPGTIYVIENNQTTSNKKVFLDIREKVLFGGEQGLLGLAFHPNFKNNGYFYLNYTANNPRRSVISRFKVSSNSEAADKSSELILLTVDQPYSNHNGGQISFGPDGFLYFSLGDGGSGGDPQNYSQNLKSLLGKIARIDVNSPSGNLHYSIPSDNPFKGNTNNLSEEIYAWGLRNVWRFSFDKQNRLWAADVGQNAWEEINLIEKGKNYGWRIMEGNHCFNPQTNCNTTNLTMPIWEYGHNQQGGYSITGGHVYEGLNAKELLGKYVYGDYVTGNIWALDYKNGTAVNSLIAPSSHNISTFGVDQNNELYFANYSTGRLYKFKGTPSTKVGMNSLPKDFQLDQNFPNPFNPTTTIQYVIPNVKTAHLPRQDRAWTGETSLHYVTLKIYDILGREVVTLIDELLESGTYQAKFSNTTSQLNSGVYFYRLAYGNSYQVKKMILSK